MNCNGNEKNSPTRAQYFRNSSYNYSFIHDPKLQNSKLSIIIISGINLVNMDILDIKAEKPE